MKKLPLNDWHKKYGKMAEFAGWEMPIWYDGIKKEHLAVRNGVGAFDVSHMGEILFEGKDALEFLQLVTTNDISRPPAISGTYTLVLNERGAIKDETLVYNMGKDTYMMVCDAVAVPKLVAYFDAILKFINKFKKIQLRILDKTDEMCLFSIQGPKASSLCQDIFSIDLNEMWWFQAKEIKHDGTNIVLSKSGYTGENGFELFLDADASKSLCLWEEIIHKGKAYDIAPCGLGARDTLRIESGYTLYGNETYEKQLLSTPIDEITPLEAGLEFALFFDKEFVGKDALLKVKEMGIRKKLVHLSIMDKTIPRKYDLIYQDKKLVGEITSSTKTPLVVNSIAIGYVGPDVEGEVTIIVRDKSRKAKIVKAPFYNPKRYGAYREV